MLILKTLSLFVNIIGKKIIFENYIVFQIIVNIIIFHSLLYFLAIRNIKKKILMYINIINNIN